MIGFNKEEFGKFWDKLNDKDACIISSMKGKEFQDLNVDLLYRIFERAAPGDMLYRIGVKLKGTIAGDEKIPSSHLFDLLEACSERTAFSTDIRHCPHILSSCEAGFGALKESNNVVAFCCLFLEKTLVGLIFC
ncbi:hypothetical protein SEVIR_7G062201v4 [Setaria viridis]|uniref:Uncharacterized protein n=1 Tax=Setaria viridis TaxID=4556 RepID=A0A4U6U118_SETVI|nr:hypothetical protein SEVIR_7G062201v2 [Setaria viridis]